MLFIPFEHRKRYFTSSCDIIRYTPEEFFDDTISRACSRKTESFYDADSCITQKMKSRHRPNDKVVLIDQSSNREGEFFSIDHRRSMLSPSVSYSYETETHTGNNNVENILFYKSTRPYECLGRKREVSCHITENRHKLRYDIDHHDRYGKNQKEHDDNRIGHSTRDFIFEFFLTTKVIRYSKK